MNDVRHALPADRADGEVDVFQRKAVRGDLFQREALSGVEFAFGLVAVAVALVAGLLFANLALPPRRSL